MNERPTARGAARHAAPDTEGEFITAPVPAPGRRPASRSRLAAIVGGTALLAFLAVTLAGWAIRRDDVPATGAVVPFAAAPAPAVRRTPATPGWYGALTVPGRSAQTAILLLRQPAGDAQEALEFSLWATTWLARGRAALDPASATLRLDGRVRFVRETAASGRTAWRAVAPWQGVLEEVPR